VVQNGHEEAPAFQCVHYNPPVRRVVSWHGRHHLKKLTKGILGNQQIKNMSVLQMIIKYCKLRSSTEMNQTYSEILFHELLLSE
jgi:hypothetical protein